METHFRLIVKKLASPALTFAVLPYMMLLLILGTIAQKPFGLYGALDVYFYSGIIWVGILPLPGGLTVMAAFFINLLARFIGYSVWSVSRIGIHLAHLGVLLLLIGGIIAGVSRIDTVIPIAEGETVKMSQSYDQSVFNIYKNDTRLYSHSVRSLDTADFKDLPFTVKILDYCRNCRIELRTGDVAGWQGPAQKMMLTPAALEKDPEQNLPGASFELSFNENRNAEKHATFLYFPKPPEVEFSGDTYRFTIERRVFPLPFEIALKDFSIALYPGTLQAESYQSEIEIIDNGQILPAAISMNKPVSYKGYRLYQSAYRPDNAGDYISIIAVVYNKGRIFPYLAGFVIGLGLLLHLIFKFKGRIALSAVKFTCLLFLLIPQTALAETPSLGKDFASLPILHDGRIKPIDSFARVYAGVFSGSEKDAVDKIAVLLFKPQEAVTLKIFKIESPELVLTLGLTPHADSLYSYKQIAPGLEKTRDKFIAEIEKQRDREKLDPRAQALIGIHSKALYFLQLVRSFSYAMPLDGSSDDLIVNYRALQKNAAFLKEALESLHSRKGDAFESYSKGEQQTAWLNYQLNLMDEIGRNNVLFRVVPSSGQEAPFAAPWQILTTGKGLPQSQAFMKHWTMLMLGYRTDRQDVVDHAVKELHMLYADYTNAPVLMAEYYYNRIDPVLSAMILAFLTGVLFLTRLKTPAFIAATATAGMLGVAVAMRLILLDRPPVGTLYESILFVCLILCLALYGCRHMKRRDAIFALSFSAIGLLLWLAHIIDTAQDNFQPLEAVLNTNFWLATHVLVITAGYGWCLLTSALAHIRLVHWSKSGKNNIDTLHSHALMALSLITVGTILGGVWADMSWGRFWGWDPKENGALLIALWLIWVLHSRASGHLSPLFFTFGLAALSIIVMLSWFGVNLLSVGLHSYGFIDGIALALFGFIAVQSGIFGFLFYRLKTQ